jgi:hypothetical protein
LTTTQVASLETTDLQALKTTQIAALTTTQIGSGLTTRQIAVLTTTQLESWSSTQIQALTTTQIQSLVSLSTPIVLDLNGDGVQTLNISAGVHFDLNATGQSIQTGWVGQSDGLLVWDRNEDGKINDGSELFGSATKLDSEHKAANGYEALSILDTNNDGVISNSDVNFDQLKVWVDKNADGISQSDEFKTLDSLNITSLDTHASAVSEKNNGNWVGLKSSYITTDGQSHEMADVWFVTDNETVPPSNTDQGLMNENSDLRTQVNDLVQAIATFDDSQFELLSKSENALTELLPSISIEASLPSVTYNVGGLVDTLKQFDANGNMINSAGQTDNPLQTGVGGQSSGKNGLDPAKDGFLAS